jgi:hypothetical protein
MQILKRRFRSQQEFMDAYQRDLEQGGLFFPTGELQPGIPVICEVSGQWFPRAVLVRCTVKTWRPSQPRLQAGAIVEFKKDEAAKRDYILEMVRRGVV